MIVGELRAIFDEALAYHEAFRRYGFPSEEIYSGFLPTEFGNVFTLGVRRGKKDIHFGCGFLGAISEVEVAKQWTAVANAWNTSMTEDERKAIWEKSTVASNTVAFAARVAMTFGLPPGVGPGFNLSATGNTSST